MWQKAKNTIKAAFNFREPAYITSNITVIDSKSTDNFFEFNEDPFSYSAKRYNFENPIIPKNKPESDAPCKSAELTQCETEKLQKLLDKVNDWNWNVFEFAESCPGGKPLFILTWHLFQVNGLFEIFNISLQKFNNFLWRIQEGYRDLPCTKLYRCLLISNG